MSYSSYLTTQQPPSLSTQRSCQTHGAAAASFFSGTRSAWLPCYPPYAALDIWRCAFGRAQVLLLLLRRCVLLHPPCLSSVLSLVMFQPPLHWLVWSLLLLTTTHSCCCTQTSAVLFVSLNLGCFGVSVVVSAVWIAIVEQAPPSLLLHKSLQSSTTLATPITPIQH